MPLDNTNWKTETDEITEILIRARSFLERGWCRRALAKDKNGNGVMPEHQNAVEWCMTGALIAAGIPRAEFRINHPAVRCVINAIDDCEITTNIAYFNNSQQNVKPVLAVFDRAIATWIDTKQNLGIT